MKNKRVLAKPPKNEFSWIDDFDSIETLTVIYAKLESLAHIFSRYDPKDKEILGSEIYGLWFMLRDICDDLADILKVDNWTGEVGINAPEK
jgi:hypothetical protein